MTTATLIYAYKKEDNALYIHYPHFTEKVNVESGIDGDYAVFEDEFALNEFLGYLEDHDLDTSEINGCMFGGSWDNVNAIALKELL